MFEDYVSPQEMRPSDPRFGVGPSLIPSSVVHALTDTGTRLLGTGHRGENVKNIVRDIREGLRTYFDLPADYQVILGIGGATFLFDAIGLGLVQKEITHFVCGEFSNKWYQSSSAIPWIQSKAVIKEMGEGITPTHRFKSDTLAVTLNETSTGVMLGPLGETDSSTLVCMDATSGAGQIPCDFSKVDVYFFSPQKVFASEGGLYLAILSPAAIERAEKIHRDASRYIPPIMNLITAKENSAKDQTYTTPALSTLFFLQKQIETMNKIGEQKIVKEAKRKAQLIYSWAEEKPYLSCYIKEEKYRSLSTATIDVDPRVDVAALLKCLHRERSVYNINSYRKLARNQFRIGMFHNITHSDLEKLTRLLSHAIESVLV